MEDSGSLLKAFLQLSLCPLIFFQGTHSFVDECALWQCMGPLRQVTERLSVSRCSSSFRFPSPAHDKHRAPPLAFGEKNTKDHKSAPKNPLITVGPNAAQILEHV